ncbi:ANTAR domain-containing protein [Sinomonas sp. JGH33]|uniref:ANTAR domain-containing protein n=1 Tax=Sinomonas terricola TaxID=3110330 RepID=A0ABU5T9U5_9MICC|nr:ANTAR domain-containing protein [Sinomonas sp. JGH33]MEA5456448.1 ANTAR domain-containing protein [Sinomonas sp. JGH33]
MAPRVGESAAEGSRLYRLLLERRTLQGVMDGLAIWAGGILSEHRIACGIVLERPRRPTLVSASDRATDRLIASWLARAGGSPLEAVLGDAISLIAAAGTPPERALVALPIRLEDGAAAALVLRGCSAGPQEHKLLGAVGHCRRDVAWVLRLAARYARQCDLADQRAAAMENRTAIDIAIGVIMGQNRCAPEDAFEILKRASNARNDKLRHVAQGVVAGVTASEIRTKFDE